MAVVPCLPAPPSPTRTSDWRAAAPDTTAGHRRDLEAAAAGGDRAALVAREVAPRLPARVIIPVYVHVIKGTHRGERNTVGPQAGRAGAVAILNDAMAGSQSAVSAPTRYRFELHEDRLHQARRLVPRLPQRPARHSRMKRALHRGDARTLNLYINGGGPEASPVLGWARFPWQYAGGPARPRQRQRRGLPGGRATGYNLGDTVIHEVGHWLGPVPHLPGWLRARGDLVADTAAEARARASTATDGPRHLPGRPGLDPVHNFMDYSLDSCMNRFTAGQVARMDAAFAKWRQ